MAKTERGQSNPSTTTPETNATSESPRAQPAEEEIAVRAYHIYLGRGEGEGNPSDDWLQAEREITEGIVTTVAE